MREIMKKSFKTITNFCVVGFLVNSVGMNKKSIYKQQGVGVIWFKGPFV